MNMKLMFSTSKFIAYEHVDSEKIPAMGVSLCGG